MLQYRQRIIDALIDCAGTHHSDDSAHEKPSLSRLDLNPSDALELGPRFALLTHHGAKPITHSLTIGNQLGAVPPILLIHVQQLAADDNQTDQHHAAHDAEKNANDPVQRTQTDAASEVAEQHAGHPTNQQNQHQNH